MRVFFLPGALVMIINVNAQSPNTNFSVVTGFMKGIVTDDVLGPYIFKGTNGLLGAYVSRQKTLCEHDLQVLYSSIKLNSIIQNIPKVSSQFLLLKYSFQVPIISQRKTMIWMGPGLLTRLSRRNIDYGFSLDVSGEAIGSLDIFSKLLGRYRSQAGLRQR